MVIGTAACQVDPALNEIVNNEGPTPYQLTVPAGFPNYFLEAENTLTVEGVALGNQLFHDPILSKNSNISCGSCHERQYAFADPRAKSLGTHGGQTAFHSMPLFNMAWMTQFFWDGRAFTREEQALMPVRNPVEMDLSWVEAVNRLQAHPVYPSLFEAAFGTSKIDSTLVANALVQYEMTLVSANSRYDRWLRGEVQFTDEEELGYQIFSDFGRGDCIHCHQLNNPNLSDNGFHNNGLDTEADMQPGLMAVTNDPADCGKFKTPSLRNLAFTAPYMHDGRFATLRDVVRFYSFGVNNYPCVDPFMEFKGQGGVQLDSVNGEWDALIAFLLTLSDSQFVAEK